MAGERSAIMTVREVSNYMRVHPSTIYRALKEGEIKSFRVGSDHRFRKADIDDWIDRQVNGPLTSVAAK